MIEVQGKTLRAVGAARASSDEQPPARATTRAEQLIEPWPSARRWPRSWAHGGLPGGRAARGELVPPPPPVAAPPRRPRAGRAPQPRALSPAERAAVLEVLHEPSASWTQAPASVYATLLDEGAYLASSARCTGCCARAGRPATAASTPSIRPRPSRSCWPPRPNQVWSWDITKLLGPAKWTYFYLYVILDVYSRYVVGWMVAHREPAALAERLIAETIAKQQRPGRPADPPRRPGHLDDLQAGRASCSPTWASPRPTPGPTSPTTTPTPRPVQDPQVPPRLPGPLRLASRTPAPSARTSSAGTTTSTATPASACCPPPSSTTARPAGPTRPRPGARRRLRRPSRALRPQATHSRPGCPGGLDQQAHRPIGAASAIS